MRACVFLYNQGDDFQEHSALPLHIPDDFPSRNHWQTKLKNARETRNRADYDLYPQSDQAWKNAALALRADADLLLKETRAYLANKGCPL